MSILVGKTTRVLVQGITGKAGAFHAAQMKEYGTQVVGGVTPGKGGAQWDGIPVFHTVAEAVRETGADASCLFVPALAAADAMLEAADAGIRLIVAITEGIPTLDMIGVKRTLQGRGVRIIGPNCPGIITPGACKIGIMPGYIHKPGSVGLISRSGTLTYEAVWQLSQRQLGQSTCVGIGGDPVIGTTFTDLLALFQQDAGTEAIVLIGEIGGTAEEEAAAFIKAHVTKPVIAFVAGQTAPPEKRMGHAGAVITGGQGTCASKFAALQEAGAVIVRSPAAIGETVAKVLREAAIRG
ncbi:MAG: succinate--CoA ligase subunit alpha [Omnitrophica WOR_2 bacterium RIFCSPHIGHO2_02_FULL_68_15]|nr:MAG: succinate--CoA ligase subunit alpha [Omnitrophica WOR_2 bacterium RIFCSPHIGHO2_02_FULL_68_15]